MSVGFVMNGCFIGSNWFVEGSWFAINDGGCCNNIEGGVGSVNRVAWRVAACSPTFWFTKRGGIFMKDNAPPVVCTIGDVMQLKMDVA